MGEYRRPEETQRKIDEIKRTRDVKSALEGIVDLFENYVNYEEKVPVRYDERTGKPIEFKWQESTYNGTSYPAKFEPSIYLGGPGMIDPSDKDVGLESDVINHIKKEGPLLIDTKFGKYVFKFEKRDASGTEQGGGTYHATNYFISVHKVKEL